MFMTNRAGEVIDDNYDALDLANSASGRYAWVAWLLRDLQEVAEQKGFNMSDDEAEEWFCLHGEGLVKAQIDAGWAYIEENMIPYSGDAYDIEEDTTS
jgi:hypothetical protein